MSQELKNPKQAEENFQSETRLENAAVYVVDKEEEKRVVRKIDRVILPLMAFVYFFQYLDKQNINYAAIFGLRTDLHLSGSNFSWVVSLFYFGQLCSQYPAAYLMSRVRITDFVGIAIVLWGAVHMCLAASQGFRSLAAVRFLLGFFEGAVSPSFVIIISNWYCRREHPVRVATWVSMFGVSQIIGALLMYAVGQANTSFQTWRLMFLICGGLTIITGTVFLWLMPRDASTAWFLNERERRVATERLALDRATRDRTNFNWRQAKEAFGDPRTYMYALMGITITLPTAIVKFSSIVIQGFGFSAFQTLLVGLPGGAVAFCLVWIGALVPTYYPHARCYTGVFVVAMPLLGSLLLLLLPSSKNWGIVVSTWFAGSTAPPLNIVLGLLASNVRGNTKKSVVGAVFFVIFCTGSIASPQFWQADDAPRYRKGCIVSVCSWVGLLALLVAFLVTAKLSNAKRDRRREETDELNEQGAAVSVDSDHTERSDARFRYTY